jgi:hypothetical protein
MKIRNSICGILLIPLLLVCFGLSPTARAETPFVVPAPDGFYPGFNTAEGQFSLLNLTSGQGNTAIGFAALKFVNTGSNNTALGVNAGLFITDAVQNTAIGQGALQANNHNAETAVGFQALSQNTTGAENAAFGFRALSNNTTAGFSVAVGFQALDIATGGQNTAVGDNALGNVTTGSQNTAIGDLAGLGVNTASNVIAIGAFEFGANVSNSCFIDNIFGQTGGPQFVAVNSAGKLGTFTSSRRFKDDIKPMDKTSELLYRLKPVSFRYKAEIDPLRPLSFGLIAEDVEKISPDLVIRGKDGKVNSVRYEGVNAMLLNEFLKEHKKMQQLEATVAQQQKGMEVLTAQLKEQAAQIQKVSAQVELNKPAPSTVANK